jgi:hypothetical protein
MSFTIQTAATAAAVFLDITLATPFVKRKPFLYRLFTTTDLGDFNYDQNYKQARMRITTCGGVIFILFGR